MLARLFRYGKLTHPGGFANLATGRVSSLPIDPAVLRCRVNQSSSFPQSSYSAAASGVKKSPMLMFI